MSTYQMSFSEAPHIEQIDGMWRVMGVLTMRDDAECEHIFHVSVWGCALSTLEEFIITQHKECGIHPEICADPGLEFWDEDEQSFAYKIPDSQLEIKVTPHKIQTSKPYQICYHIAVGEGVDTPAVNFGLFSFSPPECVAKGESWEKSILFDAPKARIDFHVSAGEIEAVTLCETNGHTGRTHGPVKAVSTISLPEQAGTYFESRGTKEWKVLVKGAANSKFIITPLKGARNQSQS